MFRLAITDHIQIAHSFADPFFGPATRMHGATYEVDVELRVPELNDHHVVVDIGALRAAARRALDTLDHRNLDDHPAFPGRTSTTERVAEHIAGLVAAELAGLSRDAAPRPGATLAVVLRESPVAFAAFERPL